MACPLLMEAVLEVICTIIAYILCLFQTNRVLGFSVLYLDVGYALLPRLHPRFSVVVALDEMKTRFQSQRTTMWTQGRAHRFQLEQRRGRHFNDRSG
jgi:hypothetical protein